MERTVLAYSGCLDTSVAIPWLAERYNAQVVTVSYGEERPAAEGGEEAAYAQNRRVELVHAQ